jgi:hypothetical protein
MITVVVGKRRNTTPWFSAVDEKKRTNHNRKLHELRPQPHDRNRKLHEPRPNRSVDLTLGSTVQVR